MAEHVDDMAFLMAIQSQSNVHGPASYLQNTKFLLPGFPSAGSWISYALGRLTNDLPAFIVMPDMRRLPYNGMGNFSSGFLTVSHQAYFQGINQATITRCLPIPNTHETYKCIASEDLGPHPSMINSIQKQCKIRGRNFSPFHVPGEDRNPGCSLIQ